VLDDSIGCALWFAARGKGLLDGMPYQTTARVGQHFVNSLSHYLVKCSTGLPNKSYLFLPKQWMALKTAGCHVV